MESSRQGVDIIPTRFKMNNYTTIAILIITMALIAANTLNLIKLTTYDTAAHRCVNTCTAIKTDRVITVTKTDAYTTHCRCWGNPENIFEWKRTNSSGERGGGEQ